MTEDEAKEKWCPHVVASHTDPRRGFRVYEDHNKEHACIASACMAWRKVGSKCKDRRGNFADRDLDGTGKWVEDGYCGLAGEQP